MQGGHEHDSEAALVRPFLARLLPTSADEQADDGLIEAAAVRSYAITNGRATAAVHLEFESMLQVTAVGAETAPRLTFERAAIVKLCTFDILSVAELSARLQVPIGVIRVVAADLVIEGCLEAFLPSFAVAEDVDLITRLIEGVRAL
jgi:Protein of unknown function (DUF742)